MVMKNSGSWIYEYDREYPCKYELTEVRYILGEVTDPASPKALICIGVNPSTALPENLDPTLSRVQAYARQLGYGSWYMLNLYPQRSTNPDGMDKTANEEIVRKNFESIRNLFDRLETTEIDVWCAWGNSIDKRDYLMRSAQKIYDLICARQGKTGILIKGLTSSNNPFHPLVSSVKWTAGTGKEKRFIKLNPATEGQIRLIFRK